MGKQVLLAIEQFPLLPGAQGEEDGKHGQEEEDERMDQIQGMVSAPELTHGSRQQRDGLAAVAQVLQGGAIGGGEPWAGPSGDIRGGPIFEAEGAEAVQEGEQPGVE